MSSIVVNGDSSGSITLQAPSVSGATVLTLPTTSGTLVVGSSSPTFTNLTTTGNTILGDATTDTLNASNGTIVLNGTGNVGIGNTPSGTYKLEVTGKTYSSGGFILRSLALTSTSGTITPASDTYDQVNYSLTGTSTFAAPSGTPVNGQKLTLRIYAASTQTISWTTTSTGYRIIGVSLPTSIVGTKTTYVGCIWNSTDLFWDVVAVSTQA